MRILLIEDNADLSAAMLGFLKARGFTVGLANCIVSARELLVTTKWGAILLDLHLPDGDGLTLLPTMRRESADASVIVLTARDQISDRIRGLDAGADDYLVKPFNPDELLARLRAIERRKSGATSAVLTLGALRVDLGRCTVSMKGMPIELTAKEWGVLRVMAERPDRVHSKESLGNALYEFNDEVTSNTLEVYISNLRRKLGRNCIETMRGIGYRLTGDST
jgi:two-component system, OmpR family, response regulator